jgi:hypothetical protein
LEDLEDFEDLEDLAETEVAAKRREMSAMKAASFMAGRWGGKGGASRAKR